MFIGPAEAGKTTITSLLQTGEIPENPTPTLSFEEGFIQERVKILELGGQTYPQSLWNNAIDQQPMHIFYVIDLTKNYDRMSYLDWISPLGKNHTLLANKSDLIKSLPTRDKKEIENFLQNLKNNQISPLICSAINKEGIMTIGEIITSIKLDQPDEEPSKPITEIIKPKEESNKEDKTLEGKKFQKEFYDNILD